ncbi:MAG: TolC family protein, partial [Clostridium sp.]|nr:TolC family protein [Clostridium sp.]
MKSNKILLAGAAIAMTISMDSCGIYGKYETPDNTAITSAYAQARQDTLDAGGFGNMLWENVFTDPLLADYINQALQNNTSLRNAQSNVKIAQANLQGARLAYLPSLTLAPNGGASSYGGSAPSWTYSIQATASWEIDIFGKTLNNKRKAQAAVYQSEAYAQAVRSQIISGVANCYYGIAIANDQLALYRHTADLWKESVEVMKNLKEAGRTTEAAVVQSTANYYSILAGITDVEVSLRQLNNTMSLLLNVMPQEWAVSPEANLQMPTALEQGVPMSVLAA